MQLAELGHGTFGMVVKALDIRTMPPSEVAIKMLPRGDFVSSHCSSSCVSHSCAHQVLMHTCHGFSCITDPKCICHLLHLHLHDVKQSTAYPVVKTSRSQSSLQGNTRVYHLRLLPQHHQVGAEQCTCCSADQELQDIREEGDPEPEPLAASFDSFHQGGMSQSYRPGCYFCVHDFLLSTKGCRITIFFGLRYFKSVFSQGFLHCTGI